LCRFGSFLPGGNYWTGEKEYEYEAKVVYALKMFKHEAYRREMKRKVKPPCDIDGAYNVMMPMVADSLPSNAHLEPALVGLGAHESLYDEIDAFHNSHIRYQRDVEKQMNMARGVHLHDAIADHAQSGVGSALHEE